MTSRRPAVAPPVRPSPRPPMGTPSPYPPDPRRTDRRNDMARFEDTIDVDAPIRIVYDQWTQFEEFPRFMDGVDRVVQRDDRTLDWTAHVAGQRKQWTAEITDQTPDTRIAWKSISGDPNAGVVLFESLAPGSTRITLNARRRSGRPDRDRWCEPRLPRAAGEGRPRTLQGVHRVPGSADRGLARRDPRGAGHSKLTPTNGDPARRDGGAGSLAGQPAERARRSLGSGPGGRAGAASG